MAEVRIISYRGRNVVWPPYVIVKLGETIVFKAVNTEATVFLPKPELFEFENDTGQKGEKGAPARKGVVKVKDKPVSVKVRRKPQSRKLAEGHDQATPVEKSYEPSVPGIYPYAVYCKTGNDFAEGNTSPIMIIEPPDDG